MRFVKAFRHVCVLLFCIGLEVSCTFAQVPTHEWVWLGGSDGGATPPANDPAVAGQSGTFTNFPSQNYPGGRYGAASWTDANGNFWFFGGSGFASSAGASGLLDDLWEINPSTQIPTWIKGNCGGCQSFPQAGANTNEPGAYGQIDTLTTGNVPGSRYLSQYWTDSSGNFWLFGGIGYDANGQLGSLSDLWIYSPTANIWTWVLGSNLANSATVTGTPGTGAPENTPGGRSEAFVWTDANGNIWLFGGVGVSGYEDDLWQFNMTSYEWIYEGSGQGTGSYGGGYGVPGVPLFPGSRTRGTSWTDSSGNLWLFGGIGTDYQDGFGGLNDLWELNPSTLQWSWVGGTPLANQVGTQLGLGQFSAQNIPSGRGSQVSWTDNSGNIWILGGSSYTSAGTSGTVSYDLNDIWEFSSSLQQWAWMGGTSDFPTYPNDKLAFFDQHASYGTQAASSPGSFPAGRNFGSGWTDTYGNLWLFGGAATLSNGTLSSSGTQWDLNDLWEEGIPTPQPDLQLPGGTYSGSQSLTITDMNPAAQIYYSKNGTPPALICPSCFLAPTSVYSSPIQINQNTSIQSVAIAPGFINSALSSATYNIPVTPSISVQTSVQASGVINTSQQVQVTAYVSAPGVNQPFAAPSTSGTVVVSSGSYQSTPVPLVEGVAFVTLPAGALSPGTDTLAATYTPDATSSLYYSSATATTSISVVQAIPTTITIASTANPQEAGQQVLFVARVRPIPTIFAGASITIDGTMTWSAGLDSTGSMSTGLVLLSPGLHTVVANFGPVGPYAASISAVLQQTISSAATSIATFSGSGQSTPYGLEFTEPLVAVVKDSSGNLVPGALVTFSGAGLRFSSTTAVTNANGQAIVRAFPTAAGAATAIATANGMSGAASFSLNATKAMLLVKANSATYTFDQPIPAPTYSFSGFVNGDTAATAVTGTAAISSPATQGSAAGTYPIGLVQGTLSAPNYSLVFEQGTITITP